MSRMMAAFRHDVRFQVRHRFYAVYLLVTFLYVVFLHFLPIEWKVKATVVIILSDPSALGYFFISGIVLLEKEQSIYENLFIAPLRVREYIGAKVLSLSLLSVGTSTAIHLFTFGFAQLSVLFILGVFLTSAFFTLIGLGIAVRCQTLNDFFLVSPLYTLVFTVPLLGYVGWMDTPLYYLLPTQASLLLIEDPFQPLEFIPSIALLGWFIVWVVIAYRWAERSFQHYIIRRIGGISS
ncbi:ABC transporter permease [Laceyella putida]|uniref:ABC transporter permease n=1 Tax=Laceyella putida TaxID=110101 RepID=A0ABW2RPS9_9BACL